MGGRGSAGETGQRRRLSSGSACKRGGAYQRADALLAGSHASPQSSARTARGAGPMLVQADLRQFPAHSERHEKHAEHVVIEVAHAGCLRRRDAARPCEAAVPCISVICTTAARASGPARTATIVALCAGWDIYGIGALPGKVRLRCVFSHGITKNRCYQPSFCTVGGKGPKWSYQPCHPCRGALSSSPVHRALVLVLGTNIAVLLDCSKSSRQCSLPSLLTCTGISSVAFLPYLLRAQGERERDLPTPYLLGGMSYPGDMAPRVAVFWHK